MFHAVGKKMPRDLSPITEDDNAIYKPNRRSTSDWPRLASDKDVTARSRRVCNASNIAPSSFGSASTRLSAPVVKRLLMLLMKVSRVPTTARLEPKLDALLRNVVVAVSRLVRNALM